MRNAARVWEMHFLALAQSHDLLGVCVWFNVAWCLPMRCCPVYIVPRTGVFTTHQQRCVCVVDFRALANTSTNTNAKYTCESSCDTGQTRNKLLL